MLHTVPTPRESDCSHLDHTALASVHSQYHVLVDWLTKHALPGWWQSSADQVGGGFFETRNRDGAGVDSPRRTRVVARQIYVFAAAKRLGWSGPADEAILHGATFFLRKLRQPSGYFVSAVRTDGVVIDPCFDLYEQAFALFGLASMWSAGIAGGDPVLVGRALLHQLERDYKHPLSGYHEGRSDVGLLRANPHMHMLEALIAFRYADSDGDLRHYDQLADEIACLCVDRLMSPVHGAVREYFDSQWMACGPTVGVEIEPGHQFEWGALLMEWGTRRSLPILINAGMRLIKLGENYGINSHTGLVVNALDSGLSIADAASRLWPQTERLKAWCLMARFAPTSEEREHAMRKIHIAASNVRRYFTTTPAGMWHEHINADGCFREFECRTSSLYHIVTAIEAMRPLCSAYALELS